MSTLLLLGTGLALLGAVFPAQCVYARLWQLKEWRLDRLREHLDREGYAVSLLGTVRPAVVGIWIIIGIVLSALGPTDSWFPIALAALICLGLVHGVQAVRGALPRPQWTRKAQIIVALGTALNMGIWYFSRRYGDTATAVTLLTLPLLQPGFVGTAVLIFSPIDRWQKRRLYQHARELRQSAKDLVVIGITGSVGKTTVKALLGHLLEPLDAITTPAYVNSDTGVARWLIQQLQARTPRLAVIEMGAYRRGEIALLCDFCRPNRGIITLIGTQHIALFGSQQNILVGKSELFAALSADGRAYLNGDHALTRETAAFARCPVVMVGTGGQLDVEARDIEETPEGLAFQLGPTRFRVPLHGTHNVVNVALAISAARDLGMDDAAIQSRLSTFAPPSRTFSVQNRGNRRFLDDTHNSSASSMKAAIAWAKTQPYDTKILITCGLIEMGDTGDTEQEAIGALAGAVFQRIIFVGRHGRSAFMRQCSVPLEGNDAPPPPAPPGALVVAVGRVPESLVQSILAEHP